MSQFPLSIGAPAGALDAPRAEHALLTSSPLTPQPDNLSKHWPTHYRGRVPVKVRMTRHLGPDFWGILHPGTPRIWLSHGEEYSVKCNQHGALWVMTPHGELGIKPGEHEIIEWREPIV